jgi:zinc finger SWIM domain-containing protein 3
VDKKNGHITIFLADGQSIMDYKYFGDVVYFDTTFQTNKSEMPFARFLAPTITSKQYFGCALMFNETILSFICLFESFVKEMCEKHPSTIFTYQDAAMAATIGHLFPNTTHRLCLWHICQNAVKHLGPIIEAAEDETEDK